MTPEHRPLKETAECDDTGNKSQQLILLIIVFYLCSQSQYVFHLAY